MRQPQQGSSGEEEELGGRIGVVAAVTAAANRESPSEVNVSQPSDALVAQADAKGALSGLFLGLGAVALLVGAVAGLIPAFRAARLSPTQALWSI